MLNTFFRQVFITLDTNKNILKTKISNKERKTVLDGLGKAGSTYRETIYNSGFTGEKTSINKEELLAFFNVTKAYLEHTILLHETETGNADNKMNC